MRVFDVQKYPPSLLFSLVTLAPTLALLALADGRAFDRGVARAIVVFGRVPLFFYLLQWVAAHVAGLAVTALWGGDLAPYFMHVLDLFQLTTLPRMGGPLWVTYVCWAAAVAVLYWPCRWFAGLKARRREWWLSYL
jgi:hypothetical protein